MARTNPRAFASISTGDPATDMLQQRVAQNLAHTAACPLLNGLELEVELVAGTNVIAHKLGRKPKGCIVISMRGAAARVFETVRDAQKLVLQSDVAASATFWVF